MDTWGTTEIQCEVGSLSSLSSGESDFSMSTLNTIGVILAAIPLVLELIQAYPVRTCGPEQYEEGQRERKSFTAELRHVYFLLLDFLRDLILDNVSDMPEERKIDLGSYDCERRKFLEVWEGVMNDNYDSIKMAARNTGNDLETVVQSLRRVLQTMFHISEDSILSTLNDFIKREKRESRRALDRKLSSKFKFGKRGAAIRNKMLDELTNAAELVKNLRPVPSSKIHRSKASKKTRERFPAALETGRKYAYLLHKSMAKLWDCSCHNCMEALLRIRSSASPSVNDFTEPAYSLIFTFELKPMSGQSTWAYQEVDLYLQETY